MSRVKDSGAWKGPNRVYAKISNAWQEVYYGLAKVSGAWRNWLAIVPNVVGQTTANADPLITARGFSLGTKTVVVTRNASLDEQIISQTLNPGDSEEPGTAFDYTYYNYVPPFFPPYFPPFFPPYFPPFFPPFFPPYFPPFFPPFFPPYFTGYGKSIGVDTLVRTPDGLVAAKDLVIGDTLLSADIEGFPYMWSEDAKDNAINWRSEDPNVEIKETVIVDLYQRWANWAVVINYDIFSDTHYILIMRDGESQFVDVKDVLETDLIWSYETQQFEEIFILEYIEVPHEVVCINTEPFDMFFTEQMLVHDSHQIVDVPPRTDNEQQPVTEEEAAEIQEKIDEILAEEDEQ